MRRVGYTPRPTFSGAETSSAIDPLTRLVNVVGPMAALCAAVLARRSIKSRRWPCYSITALLTFAVTSACLGYEVYSLGDYGIEIGRVWWLPWR